VFDDQRVNPLHLLTHMVVETGDYIKTYGIESRHGNIMGQFGHVNDGIGPTIAAEVIIGG
jgi:propanediol dehydratase large subunit